MSDPSCQKCKFLDRQEQDEARIGTCRRFPPQMVMWPQYGDSPPDVFERQPRVVDGDWCGEFKAGPNDA